MHSPWLGFLQSSHWKSDSRKNCGKLTLIASEDESRILFLESSFPLARENEKQLLNLPTVLSRACNGIRLTAPIPGFESSCGNKTQHRHYCTARCSLTDGALVLNREGTWSKHFFKLSQKQAQRSALHCYISYWVLCCDVIVQWKFMQHYTASVSRESNGDREKL